MFFLIPTPFLDFKSESGDPNLTGWEYIPEYGHAIYVTFNYRLDVLGHLNTEDEHATGNYALKDILEALRWVNANIHSFGGDPNNVILMGHNSGGVIVQSLLYSQEARGLFARAVSLSGSLFQTYSFQPHPKEKAEALGKALNLEWNTSQELVDQLRGFTAEQLLEASSTLTSTEMPSKNLIFRHKLKIYTFFSQTKSTQEHLFHQSMLKELKRSDYFQCIQTS